MKGSSIHCRFRWLSSIAAESADDAGGYSGWHRSDDDVYGRGGADVFEGDPLLGQEAQEQQPLLPHQRSESWNSLWLYPSNICLTIEKRDFTPLCWKNRYLSRSCDNQCIPITNLIIDQQLSLNDWKLWWINQWLPQTAQKPQEVIWQRPWSNWLLK